MNTKKLTIAELKTAIDNLENLIHFNNLLNRQVRKVKANVMPSDFNPYAQAPTQEMICFITYIMNETTFSEEIKKAYIKDAGYIFKGCYSIATNTPLLRELHQLEKQKETLEKAQGKEETDTDLGFKIVRDLETTRLNLIFENIPNEETRSLLKSNGFRWSPYLKAWTRQLTSQAEISLNRVIKGLRMCA